MRSGYRPEIDGLRAFAVASVFLYHAGFSYFAGGFVGVDVFFVISGFLITGIVASEVKETGAFDYLRFYERRVRRLFPALFIVCAVSFVASALLFAPKHLALFSASLISALTSVSNIYFWLKSGYFDADSHFKPLLHTWTLSVEEQFYFLWPPALALLGRKAPAWVTMATLLVLFALSLFANIIFAPGIQKFPILADKFANGSSTIFFLMPFRIFEFAIGAALVWLEQYQPKSNLVREGALVLGLALIACAVFRFTSHTTFPSTNALVPCFGSALVIYGGRSRYTVWLLRNRAAVGLGLISYSLYLVHWPVIVFYQYLTLAPLGWLDEITVFGISICISILLYHWIEHPFRRKAPRVWWPRKIFLSACGALTLVLIVPGMTALSGWKWRVATFDTENSIYGGTDCETPLCTHGTMDPPIYVVGESFARQLYAGLVKIFPDQRFIIFDHGTCTFFSPNWVRWVEEAGHAARCSVDRRTFFSQISAKDARVIFANNWVRDQYFDAHQFDKVGSITLLTLDTDQKKADFTFSEIAKLRDYLGLHSVLVIANPPSIGDWPDLGTCLERLVRVRDVNCQYVPLADVSDRRYLAKHASGSIPVLDPFEAFCNESSCLNYSREGLLYSDQWHLSELGSRRLIGHFKDRLQAWFNQ